MNPKTAIPGAEDRKAEFNEEMKAIGTAVDAAIAMIDSGSHQYAVDSADSLIKTASSLVGEHVRKRIAPDLAEAGASVRSSLQLLSDATDKVTALSADASRVTAPSAIRLIFALIYVACFLMVFYTEMKLTAPLAELLGFPQADPAARAIGAAFAAATVVFDLIFTKLRLLGDPFRFLSAQVAHEWEQTLTPPVRLVWRRTAGVTLLIFSSGVAILTASTIFKMAPTRPIAAAAKARQTAGQDPTPQPDERKTVETASLWFSVCILVTGGYLLAAGYQGLKIYVSAFSRRHDLRKQIRKQTATVRNITAHLDEQELPALAAALTVVGFSYQGLLAAKPKEIERAVDEIRTKEALALDTLAQLEAEAFAATKRIALSKARRGCPDRS